jgi:dipeptidyl aminopeptidase/acylaminoacyl peptidase
MLATPVYAAASCDDLIASASDDGPSRSITSLDLARVRQIGQPLTASGGPSALTASPDGRSMAFVQYRADPEANAYCVGLVLLDLASGQTRLLDHGGELLRSFNEYRGRIWDIGYPALIKPLWSPNGRSLAYLRRDGQRTQVWIVDATSGAAHQVTHAPVDVEHFAWSLDGRGIVFSARTGRIAEAAALAEEARGGFHYDDRFVPMYASVPLPDAAIPLVSFVVDVAEGKVRSASDAEQELLPKDDLGKFLAPPSARSQDGWLAQTARPNEDPFSPVTLSVTAPSGAITRCDDPACSGRLNDMWWLPGTRTLLFLRREGWANGASALYRWTPGRGKPHRLLSTGGLIDDCTLVQGRLICLAEGPTVPAHVVSIDPSNGRLQTRYDPNPNFAKLRFGQVRRLEWKNDRGLQVRGDLVLPPDYKPGQRLPLIVTTYLSQGFLQGAMGDEFPIHVFAARGFAVLSFQRPRAVSTGKPGAIDYNTARAMDTKDWTDRRSVNSAILGGVQRIIEMGIADPKRVGISGLSEGSIMVGFALIKSRMFAAAAMSSCCLEPWTIGATVGPAFARLLHQQGWPKATADDREFWAQGSIIQNAAKIDTPLLLQEADREYLLALDPVAALKEQGKPVDMYVFPDEFHIKWQPAHRLAVYDRHVDWFSFWLQDQIDPDPAKAKQFEHWQMLRKTWRRASAP